VYGSTVSTTYILNEFVVQKELLGEIKICVHEASEVSYRSIIIYSLHNVLKRNAAFQFCS
jgi:hypothetical protein